MASPVLQLTKYSDMDFGYAQKQREASSEYRQKMAKVDPEYLRSWNTARERQQAAEQSCIDLEREWLDSILELYRYAEGHSTEVVLKNGSLEFASPAHHQQFDEKDEEGKVLYRTLAG